MPVQAQAPSTFRGGDDLEDDLLLDDAAVADSDVEEAEEFTPLAGEEDAFVASDNEGEEAHGGAALSSGAVNKSDAEKRAEKKRKRRAKDKERREKKRRLTLADASNADNAASTASQSPKALADFLARGQQKTFDKLSEMELDDLRIPESSIADTTAWTSARTHETLPDFITEILPTLKTRIAQTPKNRGAPTAIVLAGNALRVADLTRAIRELKGEKGGEVTKLFARHFKLAEHIQHLKATKVGVAIGTPARVGKLLAEPDALLLNALTHIILDVSFIDAKQRSMMDIPETRDELFKGVLGHERIKKVLGLDGEEGKVKLVLF